VTGKHSIDSMNEAERSGDDFFVAIVFSIAAFRVVRLRIIRTLAAIAEAVPVRLMKRDLLFVTERLASLLDENRLSIVARRYGIKKAKDTDSLGKLFAAYLRRAEESVLGSVLIETTILYMSTRHNPAQVLNEAAAVYKVGTDAIALKVKQEFAAKDKLKKAPKAAIKAKKAA
jgi:ParB family chromosome partitioning protein